MNSKWRMTTANLNKILPLHFNWTTYIIETKKYVCLVTSRSDSGSTSTFPWLWSEGTLPAWYWHVCRFDLILVVPTVLTSITAPHLSSRQCIAFNAFTSVHFVLSVSFVVLLSCVVLLRSLINYLDNRIAYDDNRIACSTSLETSEAFSET